MKKLSKFHLNQTYVLLDCLIFKAIKRLSCNDEELIKKMCKIMAQVFYKGNKMNIMMEDLEKFRKETDREEKILQEYEGK